MSAARFFLFLWAVLLPFVSFSPEKAEEATDLASRFTVADFAGVLMILCSIAAGRWLKPNSSYPAVSAWLLLFAAAVSSCLSLLFILSLDSSLSRLAPLLIFMFLVVWSMRACALLRQERHILILASCIALGGCIESFIVGHDLVARFLGGVMWFRDSMDLRARGTFRASGQLAQYGFIVGGVLFALSAWPGAVRARTRAWWTVTAVSLLMYPVFTTRRSGIGALVLLLLVWIVVNQLNGIKGYKKALPVLVPAALILFVYLGQAEYRDFLVGRVNAAQERVAPGQGFLSEQFADAMHSFPQYPLFGRGWGLSKNVSRTKNEMHSTYLGVLVDAGVLGCLAFFGLILAILYECWRFVKMTKGTPYLEVSARLFALMIAQLAFWIHNRGLRDRGFFLFVAVLAACAQYVKTNLKADAAAKAGGPALAEPRPG